MILYDAAGQCYGFAAHGKGHQVSFHSLCLLSPLVLVLHMPAASPFACQHVNIRFVCILQQSLASDPGNRVSAIPSHNIMICFVLYVLGFRSDVSDTHYIREYAGSRYTCSGSVSLYQHGIFFIPFCCKHDYIV